MNVRKQTVINCEPFTPWYLVMESVTCDAEHLSTMATGTF